MAGYGDPRAGGDSASRPRPDSGSASGDSAGRPATEDGRSGDAEGRSRGVYMISVAAELAGMHPQTLRIYETRGLITPRRSPKNTRLYSDEDVERLRRIQELTTELGMNLAGVERVFELEQEVERMRRRLRNLERQANRRQAELRAEIERVRRSAKAELVPYEPPGKALMPRSARLGRRARGARPAR